LGELLKERTPAPPGRRSQLGSDLEPISRLIDLVGWQVRLLLRRKAGHRPAEAAIAAAIDERIEHQIEEFVGQLKHRALGAGRRLAVELRQRIRQVAAGQSEQIRKVGRQRAAGIEEVVQRVRDVLLVLIEIAAAAERCV
jgi:hypothetical protein